MLWLLRCLQINIAVSVFEVGFAICVGNGNDYCLHKIVAKRRKRSLIKQKNKVFICRKKPKAVTKMIYRQRNVLFSKRDKANSRATRDIPQYFAVIEKKSSECGCMWQTGRGLWYFLSEITTWKPKNRVARADLRRRTFGDLRSHFCITFNGQVERLVRVLHGPG